ncbi:MAG: hypothetical protein QNL62_24675 [Gammaproteobacteria bacterium]|nr:hypothetical protein [Gammaproteobacteria bacterium]
MKKLSILILSFVFVMLSTSAWCAEDLVIINGGHWVTSTMEQKRAFLFGIGNMLEIEQAMAGDHYEAMREHSIVPVLLEGLSGISIADLVMQLDKYYAQHPQDMKKAVIEVLYVDMAKPNLKN